MTRFKNCKKNSETDSHEWEGLSKVSSEDKKIDVIHSYNRPHNERLSLNSRSLDK